jgi:hypothetical protein
VIFLKLERRTKELIVSGLGLLLIALFWVLGTGASAVQKKEPPLIITEEWTGYNIPTTLDLEAIGITTTEPTTEPTTEEVTYAAAPVSNSNGSFGRFKSYTDYRMLSRSSAQWKLQEQAYTDENGLRKIGDAYLVAMGSYYGRELGSTFQVTLSNGNSFTVMLCDMKDDRHTDANNQICLSNGSVIEFYVDTDVMPSIVCQLGTVGALEQFSGSIVSIEKIA